MKIQSSMKIANEVLAEVRKLARKSKSKSTLILKAWSNCREQGYYLSSDRGAAVFSEHRVCDMPQVIVGGWGDFDTQTNLPVSEEVWYRQMTYETARQAAVAIMKHLGGG